jgi:hypothetical protein
MHLGTSTLLPLAFLVVSVAARPSAVENALEKRFKLFPDIDILDYVSKKGDTCMTIAANHRAVNLADLIENNKAYVFFLCITLSFPAHTFEPRLKCDTEPNAVLPEGTHVKFHGKSD